MANNNGSGKSLESWIWDAACSIRGAKDAPKYKDYILPLIFTKRLCDVFDDELNRIAKEVGSRKKAFQLAKADHKLVRFYLPLVPDDPEQPVWSVIRKLSDKIGEGVTTHMRAIARENPLLQGIIDRVDFNATTHGQRDLDDDRLSNLIEAISTKRLGLEGVFSDERGDYPAGTWLRNPRWSQHTPFTGPEFLADRLRFSRKQKSMTTTALDFTPLLPAGLPPAAARLLAIHAASGMRVT